MKGIVRMLNRQSGMAAARTESGDYAVFAVAAAGQVEPGDVLWGELEARGGETLRNVTKGFEIAVYLHGTADLLRAKQLVGESGA